MVNMDLFKEFTLIEVKQRPTRSSNTCSITATKEVFTIPKALVSQLDWTDGERVNLYSQGKTFALKKDKVGLLHVKNPKSGCRINSAGLCLELLSRTRSCTKYEGWVEGDILFFKPERSEDE